MPSLSSSTFVYELDYAGTSVTVACPDRVGAEIVEFLFPSATGTVLDRGARPTYRIRELGPGRLALYRGDQLICLSDSRGHLAELLMGEVCRDLVTHSKGGAVYHAGLVERGGIALLLPGTSGVGKSTLTAWLCAQGWVYHTDELVWVAEGTCGLIPLPRALSLKGDSREFLPDLFWARLERHIWPSRSGILISPRGLISQSDLCPLAARCILFGQYSPTTSARIERLSAAETCFLLLGSLVNAQNQADSGLHLSTAIASKVISYKAVYSQLSQLEKLVASLEHGPD